MHDTKEKMTNCVVGLRKKQGITQQALADAIGVTRQTVITMEKGDYTPSLSLAMKLADFFGVSVEEIFCRK